jgi:hypothetical protein
MRGEGCIKWMGEEAEFWLRKMGNNRKYKFE